MAGVHALLYDKRNIENMDIKMTITWLRCSSPCQEQNRDYAQHRVSWISQGSLGSLGNTAMASE
jgi:hypothetical protein